MYFSTSQNLLYFLIFFVCLLRFPCVKKKKKIKFILNYLPPDPVKLVWEGSMTNKSNYRRIRMQVRDFAGSQSRLAWLLYKYAALWRAVYGNSATERPLETICEEKEVSSRFRLPISSRYDLRCWKQRKPHAFLLSQLCEKVASDLGLGGRFRLVLRFPLPETTGNMAEKVKKNQNSKFLHNTVKIYQHSEAL